MNLKPQSIIATLAFVGLLAGCGGSEPIAETSPSPTSVETTAPASSPEPDRDGDGIPDSRDRFPDDPKNIAPRVITVTCDSESYSIAAPAKGEEKPNFASLWTVESDYCRSNPVAPRSDLEKAAYKASGYDDNDIGTLFAICAANNPDSVFAEPDFSPGREQIAEKTAALMLCPDHPQAETWRQAIDRGKVDVKLADEGRLFGSGTYLIGDEIKPGTYVTTDVKNCYWERQDRTGEIIDNNFMTSARRVEVTIRSSDYAFHSESCGQWRGQ